MKKFLILLCSISSIIHVKQAFSQESESFKPSGKIIARSFLEYNAGLNESNKESGFDITRAFLGYQYSITSSLSGQIIIDAAAGRTSSGSLETHLRNAFICWEDKGFKINVGQIGLLQFSLQEKYWMHRYIMKSFQDLNKMAPSVDLGLTAEYKINSLLAADISLTNGEGYKNFSKNNSNRYGAGINIMPIKNTIFRIYGDVYTDSENIRESAPENSTNVTFKNQYTLSLFAGYQNPIISAGAEFNQVYNKGMVENKNYYGCSFYTSGKVSDKWRIFARYDLTDSKKPSNFSMPWNDLDGQLFIIGTEFHPLKQVKIAPNFRNINLDRGRAEQYIFISAELNL